MLMSLTSSMTCGGVRAKKGEVGSPTHVSVQHQWEVHSISNSGQKIEAEDFKNKTDLSQS